MNAILTDDTRRQVHAWAAVALAQQAREALASSNDLATRDAARSREHLVIAAHLASEAKRRAEASEDPGTMDEAGDIFGMVRRAAEAAASGAARLHTPPRFRNPR